VTHTYTHKHVHELCSIPLDERSGYRRDLYLTTCNVQKRLDSHAPGWIRTRNPGKPKAVDTHLRPYDHRNGL